MADQWPDQWQGQLLGQWQGQWPGKFANLVRTPRPHFPFLLLLLLTPLLIVVVVLHSGYATFRGGRECAWAGPATGGTPAEEEGRAREVVAAVTAAGRKAVRTPRPPFCFLLFFSNPPPHRCRCPPQWVCHGPRRQGVCLGGTGHGRRAHGGGREGEGGGGGGNGGWDGRR